MPTWISRRDFAAGGAAAIACPVLAGAASATPAWGAFDSPRPRGRRDIPADPRRVVAIDSRISLEMALALGLSLVGYSHSRARPWVPVPPEVPFLAAPPDLEQILMLEPDLILCPDTAPQSDWWPLARLSRIAPVLPSNHRIHWRTNLARLAGWLGRAERADRIVADYDALIDGIRRRRAAAIAGKRVAAANYDALKRRLIVRSACTGYGFVMPAQVLSDLGGRAIAADRLGPYGEVALESFGEVLGQVDAILLIDFGDGAPQALAREPLWQRLSMVRAGHVQPVTGNCVFGSVYTAHYLAEAWDALFARLEP